MPSLTGLCGRPVSGRSQLESVVWVFPGVGNLEFTESLMHEVQVSRLSRARQAAVGLLLAVGMLTLGMGLGWLLGRAQTSVKPLLPILGVAPAFHDFRNQLGQQVSSTQFHGKIQVVTFLYPYCTSYCPLLANHLLGLETLLREAGWQNQVQIVAFDVDPWHTGPAQMRAFLQEYGWDPHDLRWQFLVARPEQVLQVVRDGYHVDFQQVSLTSEQADIASEKASGTYIPQPEVANPLAARVHPAYDIVHNDVLVLIDPKGRIRWMSTEADTVSNRKLLPLIRTLLPISQESLQSG